MRFAIIGTGIVGTALAVRLEQGGWKCVGINTRSEQSYRSFSTYLHAEQKPLSKLTAEADVIFITTQDSMIETVACELGADWQGQEGQIWVHCSGALSSRILCQESLPVSYLSLHPLQAFASVDVALQLLSGTHFGIEGDKTDLGIKIVELLGGIPHVIHTENKALYHAGAVVVSNYLVTLAGLGVEFLRRAGIEKAEGINSLLPLMKGSIANLELTGLPRALTGPIVRGDWEIVSQHLAGMDEEEGRIYQLLGMETLKIAEAKWKAMGIEKEEKTVEKLREVLTKNTN